MTERGGVSALLTDEAKEAVGVMTCQQNAARDLIAYHRTEGREALVEAVGHELKPWVRPDVHRVAVNAVVTALVGELGA